MRALIGRDAEYAILHKAFEEAVAGHGSVVLVTGEAGIGKTRLVAELIDAARAAGGMVLPGRCIELIGPELPYYSLLDALRSAPDTPAAASMGGLLRRAELPPAPAPNSQLCLFEGVHDALKEMASASPVVLLLEDLHWADRSTLDLLAFLSRVIRDHRILLLGTYRLDEVPPGNALARTVVELVRARDAQAVELAPLTTPELTTLLENVAGRPLPVETTEAIAGRSAGNPFFAEELLAAYDRGDGMLPRLVRDALLLRIARVESAGHAVLRVAAAVGRDVPHRLLCAMVNATPEEVDSALRPAIEHGVLMADRATATYRFRHALLAEVVYETILPGELVRLHERLAQALNDEPERVSAGELARHWLAAGRPVEALTASLRAAEEAEAVFGLAEASRHVERVLDVWSAVPDAAKLADADLPAMLARAADLADLTGHGALAVERVRRAIDLVDADADAVRAGMLHERLGIYLMPTGEPSAALAACQRATELVPPQPPTVERARVLTALGNTLMLSWRHADSQRVCAEALATAAAAGDGMSAVRAQGILGIDLCYLGQPEDGLREARAAREVALAGGVPRDVVHTHVMLCEILIASGRADEAARTALDGLAVARGLGAARSFGTLLAAYAAEGLLETGDWERAEALLTEAHRSGATFWAHYPWLLHAQLATAQGRFAAARCHLSAGATGRVQPTSAPRHARVVAELALWEGRPDDAASAVESGLIGSEAGRSEVHQLRLGLLGLRAEADRAQRAAAVRDVSTVGECQRRADELLALTRRAASRAVAITPEAMAWRRQAEAEHARLCEEADPQRWRHSVSAWDDLGRPYLAAYCRWRLVEALLVDGSRDVRSLRSEAVQAARLAYRVAGRLGAGPLRHALELAGERARIDLEPSVPTMSLVPADTLGLTSREGEVLGLLTRGYTNRDIANELTISVKTASVHVSNILRKLGVTRRLEAAAIGQRHLVAGDDTARRGSGATLRGSRA